MAVLADKGDIHGAILADWFFEFFFVQYSSFGPVAHLVERFYGIEEVRGSNPLRST